MSSLKTTSMSPADASSKRVLRIVFLIVFLDMAGFSIIFPLYPSMLQYYLSREGSGGALGSLITALDHVSLWLGAREGRGHDIVFGGFLSALYALLQFVCAPIFGSISDRAGRRPVLLFAIAGIAVSYAMWFFAGSFVLLVVSRLLGGLMSGNISTASAVIADVTSERNRSRGMAVLGFAIGVAFMFGPALGGVASWLDLSSMFPGLVRFGVNPYSAAALLALALAIANWLIVAWGLPETRPERIDSPTVERRRNPFALFRIDHVPGVSRANFTYFVFLVPFSGMMEFAITFLAKDRFNYSPRQIALMFLFVGIVLAWTQGSYVRKRSGTIGPKRMSTHGLLCVIPGMALVGFAQSPVLFYAGLVLTTVGSAQVRPCMSALVSLYAPKAEQGRILGVFRSLEGLTRAISPVLACLIYWRLGAGPAYGVAALVVVVALALATTLPAPPQEIIAIPANID